MNDYSTMPAGPSLDALVWEKVMGRKRRRGSVPRYSTDIAAAWTVVEKLRSAITDCLIRVWISSDGVFIAIEESCPMGYVENGVARPSQRWEAKADALPLAICRAALRIAP